MNPDEKFLKDVRRLVAGHGMIRRGEGVVVGLSGGADSVCLLHVLYRLRALLGIRLVAAHFDHGLRPGEDEGETRFTIDLARDLNLPLDIGHWPSAITPPKNSVEETARDARYLFLERVKRKFNCDRIALGHTRDDQAETVLIRLLRGSGPAGLSGIPPCREGGIIRPLINSRRSEIEAYLARNHLSFVTDSSNLEPHFLRNRIRMELLPLLREYQPRIVERLARTARIMREDEKWMEEAAAQWLAEEGGKGKQGDIVFPVAGFERLPAALKSRVIRLALKTAGGTLRRVEASHIDAIKRLVAGSRPQARADLPSGICARREYGHLVLAPFKLVILENFSYSMDRPGTCHLDALERNITLKCLNNEILPRIGTSPWTALLNGDRITFPLTVRNFRPGDRFVPLGMKGYKKVKDFFIERRLPAAERHRVPILLQGDDIVWVCGHRIDDRFKVTPDTRRMLLVTFDG